ncbi:hypothetical protein [Hydrogenivirga sp. 128-5-R1-1]|uniref:hypothetical protein n=1 Tax=Hydrogenivirga sp. 128-5-R1-1 TaxID=392423 RepID=UPI00015F1C18|nr:hypothetical protein [Hydrogenivirga sp. 128-5-R1-1]EDP74416.1 hypothetical protein HG1285_17559 [Hydrogenivirga sp. 128-5-R1-1]
MQKNLICQAYKDLENSLKLLEYSLSKYEPFDPTVVYNFEDLEYYDSLSFRFEKAVEAIFYFFKTLEIYLYGESSDTYRKMLQRMEKLNLIKNLEIYMEIKILRNKVVHAYLPEKLEEIYSNVKQFGDILLEDFIKIKKFIKEETSCL